MDPANLLIAKLAEEEEAPFRPALIGDPVKFAKQTKPFKFKDAALSGGVWMAGALFWGQMMNLWNKASIDLFDKRTDPYKGLVEGSEDYKKAVFHDRVGKAARLLSAGLAGVASSAVSQTLGGQPYNYMGYKVPSTPKDVVIAFTGAGSGAHRAKRGRDYDMDVADLDRRYGKNRYALFNHQDLRQAQEFLLNLPPGCRIRIQGHSYGGPSAYKLAQFASDNNIPIERLDTLDPVGLDPQMKLKGKPESVKIWENHLPEAVRPWYWPDFLATVGHAKREIKGADNKFYSDLRYNDHSGIRLVDFAGDKERNLKYDISAENPFSPLIHEGLIQKAAADNSFKDWYNRHNVGSNAAIGAVGVGGFTTLLHRLLTEPNKRSWRKDLAYGIPAGITGGAVSAGATAVNNLVGSLNQNGEKGNPITQLGQFCAMLMNKEKCGQWIKEMDTQIADAMANGKGMDTFVNNLSRFYNKIPAVFRSLFEGLVTRFKCTWLKAYIDADKEAKKYGIDPNSENYLSFIADRAVAFHKDDESKAATANVLGQNIVKAEAKRQKEGIKPTKPTDVGDPNASQTAAGILGNTASGRLADKEVGVAKNSFGLNVDPIPTNGKGVVDPSARMPVVKAIHDAGLRGQRIEKEDKRIPLLAGIADKGSEAITGLMNFSNSILKKNGEMLAKAKEEAEKRKAAQVAQGN